LFLRLYAALIYHIFALFFCHARCFDGFLKRCKRRGFCEKELPSVTQIFDDTSQHVLHTFLPDRTLLQYRLRQRSHNEIMISKTADLNDRHFILRMLCKDSY